MSPDELRLLTDPAARNDPDFVRRVRTGAKNERRRAVFSRLRVISLVMAGVGPLMLAVSGLVALASLARVVSGSFAGGAPALPTGLVPLVAPVIGPALVGVVLTGLAFWIWVPGRGLLDTGTQMQAQVVRVLGIQNGIRIKGGAAYGTVSKVTALLRVMPPSGAPYDVTHREPVLDSDISFLQNGATVVVRVSPSSPSTLLIDWEAMQ